MAKHRIAKSPTTGKLVKVEVVDIKEIHDPPTLVTLSDGSTLRMRLDVIEVARFDGEWDPDGHPVYTVRSGKVTAVLESPERLRRPSSGGSTN